MRELLFRGKLIFKDEWTEGSLIIDEYGRYYIGKAVMSNATTEYWCSGGRQNGKVFSRFVGFGFQMVIPETVGQYIGLPDKNGKKIFEGDIVESTSDLVNLRGEKSGKKITKFYEVVVTADNSSFTYGTREIGETYISRTIYKESAQRFYSVIGNIHDNPELLK